jgi:selenium-binding protein 1
MAMQAPRETLAYVALLNPNGNAKPDALGVVDVDPGSSGYGHIVGQVPGGPPHNFLPPTKRGVF